MTTRIWGTVLWMVSAAMSSAADIRRVDFQNFVFPWNESHIAVPPEWVWIRTATSTVKLVAGRHEFSASGLPQQGEAYLEMQSTVYGDLDGDGREEAAVDLRYSTGGTANWHYLFVYTLANGAPKLLGILRSGSRADGGLVRVEIRNKRLVLDFADTNRRQGDCCSDGYVRVSYRLREGRFEEVGKREYGDLK